MTPKRDDPQRRALEARLAAAAREIEDVLAECERLWPESGRRWRANFVPGAPDRAYLHHERIPVEGPEDE